MRKLYEDRLGMASRVTDYLTENATDVAESEVAAEQAAKVQAAYARIGGVRGGVAKATKKLTKEAKDAKATLLDLIPALLGPMSQVATKLGDDDLLASVTLSNKQLRKLRPLAFIGVVGSVLGSAARADVAPELAKHGLKANKLVPLQKAHEAFVKAQPAPRKTIDERVLAGATLEDLLDDLMDGLRELDNAMKAFKLLNRPIYDGYVQMRKIINSGGGGAKKGENAPSA